MKFKDKNGNVFIPTSKFTEMQMEKSKELTKIKEVGEKIKEVEKK
jgi:hypothetical protein